VRKDVPRCDRGRSYLDAVSHQGGFMSAPRCRALQIAQRDPVWKARCSVRAFLSVEAGISYREPSKRISPPHSS
jgi:hypothetical protein